MVAPYLGENMARAAVRGHYKTVGISGDEVGATQIEALVGKIQSGLNVFVGQDKSAKIVGEIMKAIEATGKAS